MPTERPPAPKQVDLEPGQYRVTKAPKEPGQPFFQKGGLMILLGFIAIVLVGASVKQWLYDSKDRPPSTEIIAR